MANRHIDDVSLLLSTQTQKLVEVYRSGDLTEAERLLNLLRLRVSSSPDCFISNLTALLEHIERGLPGYQSDSQAGSSGKKLPSLKSDSRRPTFVDENYFELLRNEYSKIYSGAVVGSTSFLEETATSEFNIPDGARLTVFWGQRLKQVLGKDGFKNEISPGNWQQGTSKSPEENTASPGGNAVYIVTPSFNSAKFIDTTILSVISQEGPIEIFYHVQDGGSTDGTVEKLSKWQSLLSDPGNNLTSCPKLTFTFQSENDSGLYDAINKGFDFLSPPVDGICTWINSDDVFTSGAIESVWKIFANNREESWLIGATCGGDEYLGEISFQSLQFPREVIRRGLCDGINWRFIQQEGSFWKAGLWAAVGGLNPSLKYCGDWDLWRRFAQMVEPVQVEWALGKFRIHAGQLTSAIADYYQEMNEEISESERRAQLDELKYTVLNPTKIVKLPNRKGAIPICERINLNSQYVGGLNCERANSVLNQLLKNADQNPIRVLTMNTLAHGGAGTGTLRRIEALRNIGVDARLVSLVSEVSHEYVGRIEPTLDGLDTGDQYKVWQHVYNFSQNQVMNSDHYRGQEMFSLAGSVIDMRQLVPLIDEADIVHIHWAVGMLDYINMPEVLARKPVVWTTADMNAFTGGCHYSEGCEGFTRECSDCPMLSSMSRLPHEVWKIKKKAYESMDITVVCPSEHMASIVRRSSLLGNKPIQVISNAYPIDRLVPINQIKAREMLDLPLDKKLLMFGSQDVSNIRKGGDLLSQVAELLQETSWGNDMEVIIFGSGDLDLPMKVNSLGTLQEDQLSAAYSAADVFVSLSREDVGPMTVVESLLCGTPVVGFPIGLFPEVVKHKSTGYCAKRFCTKDVIKGITWVLHALESDNGIGERCSSSAIKYGDPKVSAEKHRKLYQEKIEISQTLNSA